MPINPNQREVPEVQFSFWTDFGRFSCYFYFVLFFKLAPILSQYVALICWKDEAFSPLLCYIFVIYHEIDREIEIKKTDFTLMSAQIYRYTVPKRYKYAYQCQCVINIINQWVNMSCYFPLQTNYFVRGQNCFVRCFVRGQNMIVSINLGLMQCQYCVGTRNIHACRLHPHEVTFKTKRYTEKIIF